jgi:ribonuclease Z
LQVGCEQISIVDVCGTVACGRLHDNLCARARHQPGRGSELTSRTRHQNAVFITHSHADHCFGATHFVSRARKPRFFIPKPFATLLDSYLFHAQELTNGALFNAPSDFETNHITVGVAAGDVLDVSKTLLARVFQMCHSIECVGYGFFERRLKLKEEHRSKSGPEIAALRKAGVDISDAVDERLFAFCGDTTAEVFQVSPELLLYPIVIVECSFIVPEDAEQASATKHMHWSELEPVVRQNPNTKFVLIHFSHRYSLEFVHDFFAGQNVPNVVVFLPPATEKQSSDAAVETTSSI